MKIEILRFLGLYSTGMILFDDSLEDEQFLMNNPEFLEKCRNALEKLEL